MQLCQFDGEKFVSLGDVIRLDVAKR
jgi:hypothetical protein